MIQRPGTHIPYIKNRSSKHFFKLCKVKPAVRSMSNSELRKFSGPDVSKEIARRNRKNEKRAS